MAMTVARFSPASPPMTGDGKRSFKALVTFDTSYPTGGLLVDMTKLPFKRVLRADISTGDTTAATVVRNVVLDASAPAAPKLKLYTAASTEAANTSDQSLVILPIIFTGQ
jgi:hypothetical protein